MAGSGISMSRPEELAAIQAAKHSRYRELLQDERSGKDIQFWDVVMITASDEEQASMYLSQIEWRKELGFIPRTTQYFVLPDPPGTKIGNGGATLVALDFLRNKFGDKLKELRVMLIHAGGYSTRTPHHSVCGKIFAPLPVGPFRGSSMLEMCFSMLCAIPQSCTPGVLIKCGDDVIIFDTEDCDWSRPGFTALAHRSTKEVAFTHGVFCLEHGANGEPGGKPRCRRFTHKPSLERMREYGALYNEERFDAEGGKVECEVDAYGDFLQAGGNCGAHLRARQALGPEADEVYIGAGASAIHKARKGLFQALRGVELNVGLADRSRFWHIGTLPEVMNHFCGISSFLPEAAGEPDPSTEWEYKQGPEGLGYYRDAEKAESCAICSEISEGVAMGKRAMVEYSVVGPGCDIGTDCLVSSSCIPSGTTIPRGAFVHTLPVRNGEEVGYVAELMGVDDDIKKEGTVKELLWMGDSLEHGCLRMGLTAPDIWDGKEVGSLWHAKLFPVCATREEAAEASLQLLKESAPPTSTRMSFASCLANKDGKLQLDFRRGFDKANAKSTA